MSTQSAPVVKLNLEKHPNADSLSLQKIDDFTVVCRTEDWKGIEYGIYIPPDSVVDSTRPEFTFLDEKKDGKPVRIKAKRLRQIWSMGLLIPAPDGVTEGDFYETLGIVHYEPELEIQNGNTSATKGPEGLIPLSKYDIENGRSARYSGLFINEEDVYVSQKIHGQNAAYVYHNDSFHVKSRNEWKLEDATNLHWRGLIGSVSVQEYLKANPGHVVYGEQYGHNKGFKYDCENGEVKFRAFDIRLPDGRFMDSIDFISTCVKHNIPMVPGLGFVKFNMENLKKLAESKCLLGNSVCEGIVVKPLKERIDYKYGRVAIKIINPAYLEKN